MDKNVPLAYRMCPTDIDEYVGQEHTLGKDKMLYRLIKADRLSSIILWGPPGCGKTSLARVIAHSTKNKFERLNAVAAGVADIKKVVEESKNLFLNPSGKTVLFIDEIPSAEKISLPEVANIQLGMTANVSMQNEISPSAIVLPLSAIYQTDDAAQVWIVDDGKVSLKKIEVVAFADNNVQIRGLNAGDIVVVAGVHKLRDGQTVRTN